MGELKASAIEWDCRVCRPLVQIPAPPQRREGAQERRSLLMPGLAEVSLTYLHAFVPQGRSQSYANTWTIRPLATQNYRSPGPETGTQ